MLNKQKQIVILGAGYAGLVATMRLAGKTRRDNVAITLVNASDTFVERLLLHQFAASQTIPTPSIPKMLQGTGVSFVQGYVNRIEPSNHQVIVQTGEDVRTLRYDYLVYALGSTTDLDRVAGVREHAYTLTPTGTRSAAALREQLPILNQRGGRLLVCGGGATGIESAAEFADVFPNLHVELVTRGEFGTFRGDDVASYMRQSLDRLGVTIRDQTAISEIAADHAVTSTGDVIPFDLCVWTGGFVAPSIARAAGLMVNEREQVLVDPYLRSLSQPDIYGIGDGAKPAVNPGVHVRMSAFTALIMGAYGADSLVATLQHNQPKPFSFIYMGQGIALGRHDAIAYGSTPNDIPHAPYFTGGVGFRLRETFVVALHALPSIEKRLPGFFFWRGKNRITAQQAQAQSLAAAKHSA